MPHKNNRKLIRIGYSSLGIIIPRSWLRYYGLKYGDKIEIISNGTIEIKPLKKDGEG